MAIENFTKLNPLFKYSIVISLTGIVVGLISQLILPPEIPIFYGLPQTEAQLSTPIWIILPSVISLGIALLNLTFSSKIQDNYLKRVLAASSIFVSLLAVITTIKIIFLVGLI